MWGRLHACRPCLSMWGRLYACHLRAASPAGRLVVAGDSAGGNLAVGLMQALRDAGEVLPDAAVPGIGEVLNTFHRTIELLQRRFLRIIAEGLGCVGMYVEKGEDLGPFGEDIAVKDAHCPE